MTFLSAADLEQLASQIADPYGVLVRFLGWTGLRIGEAAALRVGRLDLLARRVEVVEAATEVNGRLAWGPTKTGERRTVPLPHFGGTPLASIDPLAVHEWQAGLVAAGLSPSRIRNAAQVLGQILDAAVAVAGCTATRPRDSAGPAWSSAR